MPASDDEGIYKRPFGPQIYIHGPQPAFHHVYLRASGVCVHVLVCSHACGEGGRLCVCVCVRGCVRVLRRAPAAPPHHARAHTQCVCACVGLCVRAPVGGVCVCRACFVSVVMVSVSVSVSVSAPRTSANRSPTGRGTQSQLKVPRVVLCGVCK